MSELGQERPEDSSAAEVTLVARGATVAVTVEHSSEDRIVVRLDDDSSPAGPGEVTELFWIEADGERVLRSRLAEIEPGAQPRWHLTPTAPTERSQRRRAVRARVALPVVLPWSGSLMTGATVDLSEAGMRALVDGWGLPPERGTRISATIDLDTDSIEVRGEIVWVSSRGAQWLLAMRFDGLPEAKEDMLRRRVFAALRAERAAAED